ncbi:META domain-containing protein [Nocardioides taihuensis]|uniref:META domain-containing protein n=1 Tax=Nocardioides taihuensis TaxID=1835606 RepID=A0ABW0BKK5_9ACTN
MKMLRVLAVGMALAATLAVSGCGDDSDEASDDGASSAGSASDSVGTGTVPTTADLEGMTYKSTSVTGHDLVSGTTVKLAFEADTMSVGAGCNGMGGPFAVDSGTLAWTGEPHSTMMACSDELTAQDDWLRQAFSDGWDATTDGSTLTLTQGDVTMELAMVE